MNRGVKYTGALSKEELKNIVGMPSEERMNKKRVAVIECSQEIPCNPCESSCKFNAIEIGEDITNLPRLIEDRCTGCGVCIAKCPGLAITVIDKSGEDCIIDFPFEYYPLPNVGESVEAVNREGQVVCTGEIVKIKCPRDFDKTTVISMKIPKEYSDDVRSMKRLKNI